MPAFPTKPASSRRPDLILGVDVGSTMAKAVVFDRSGRVKSSAARRLPMNSPQPGWCERDVRRTWQAAAQAIHAAVGIAGDRIKSVGITGCGNGAVFLDKQSRPLRAGILSSDTRAAEFVSTGQITRYQQPYAGQTSALLQWLRAVEPREAEQLGKVLFWKDYVRLMLTGEVAIEITDAGAAGLLDVKRRRMLDHDDTFPALIESGSIAGTVTSAAARVTGLRVGTPVVAGCLDCEAAAIGSGVGNKGELSLVAGTWSINQTFSPTLPRKGNPFLCNPSVVPGRWLVMEGSPTSASHFDWFVRQVGGHEDFTKAAALAAKSPRGGPVFIPRLFAGGAAFLGLRAGHDLSAMTRAVMEGVVFGHRSHVDQLRRAGLEFHVARLSGGAARSRFWVQLFADALGIPVEVIRATEPGALGAALLAGVAAGLWPDLATAQRLAISISSRHEPGDSYEHEFATYQKHLTLIP